MIIARSPLRVSLGGGGTDLPSYYRAHGGFLVAGALDQYVYVSVQRAFFADRMLLRYSQIESVATVADIRHPIIREALALRGVRERNLEITTMADIPAGTGLGSSGSFTTALLKALSALQRSSIDARTLAEEACHIELERLGEPIGKQDQYIAAFGGLAAFTFPPEGPVEVRRLAVREATLHELREHTLLFSTGRSRSASAILQEQDARTKAGDGGMVANLHDVKELGHRSCEALEAGDLAGWGRLMHEHWQRKRARSGAMSNPQIDAWYERALAHGALGGKLIGAGGGGFLMFFTEEPQRLRKAFAAEGLQELRYGFDFEGTSLLEGRSAG